MQLKSLSFKLSLYTLIAISLITGMVAFAQNKPLPPRTVAITDIAFDMQLSDHGCTQQFSAVATTPSLSAGGGQSAWISDGSTDYDCTRVGLNVLRPVAAGTLVKIERDFRACIQFSDHRSPTSGVGAKNCTAWASQATSGSWSPWTTDSNAKDPDGGWIFLETRALPTNNSISDVKIGVQMNDRACGQQTGEARFSPWASQGGGWSGWASDATWYDPDCTRVYLETKLTGDACPAVPTANQPTINLSDIQYVTTNRSGATVCPTGRVLTGVDQQDHAGALRLKCAVATNIIDEAATTADVALTTELTRGRNDLFHACPADSIIIGVVQDKDGRETAIRCQKVQAGSVEFITPPRADQALVNTHGIPGDRAEVNFNANKSGEWVGIGAYYNRDPYSSRGIAGYAVAKRGTPTTAGVCETPDEEPEPTNQCNDSIDNDGDGLIDADDQGCANGSVSEVSPMPTDPACAFTADKTTIIRGVDRAILSWSCTGGSGNPSISNIGTVPTASSTAVSPTQTTTYTITYSGQQLGSVTINVNEPILEEQ